MTEWRPIAGYEGYYEVSSCGQVRGCQRTVGAANGKTKVIKPKSMNLSSQKSGHLSVEFHMHGKRQHVLVHRLVLMAFVGSPPAGMEACHRNGDPQDNRVVNLYWGTRSDNVLDAVTHGTHRWSSRTHCERGHEFTPDNTRPRSSGTGRECISCMRIWKQKYNDNRRAARARA